MASSKSVPRNSSDRKPPCSDVQPNSARKPDFTCRLDEGGHVVHIDRKTGQRWGHRGHPKYKGGH